MVHNLPPYMTDEKLRQICREAAGNLSRITECRIWRDTSKLDSKGNPRSKGFAFVNFSEHKDALQCLQKLNNNPHTFTNERRPIVEFSIENLTAIRAKVRRSAHSKGEMLGGREVNLYGEKVKQQVKQSIKEVHGSGMKIMPKFLGKKLRHKNMSKTQLKKKNLGRRNTKKQDTLASDVKKSGNKKKQMTKYLALSS
ncbi:RNA recognition motif domain containing protein [Trichostrongylus colubriformis]|uniref:RNA recognition motif domain containing protein n=1 Tax=Trichostrongylus colubriformis TaxID=6319 RepID=A0AAN8GB59_TRICO